MKKVPGIAGLRSNITMTVSPLFFPRLLSLALTSFCHILRKTGDCLDHMSVLGQEARHHDRQDLEKKGRESHKRKDTMQANAMSLFNYSWSDVLYP